MSERGYERLTIHTLLDHARVERATFYTHFDGKNSCCRQVWAGFEAG